MMDRVKTKHNKFNELKTKYNNIRVLKNENDFAAHASEICTSLNCRKILPAYCLTDKGCRKVLYFAGRFYISCVRFFHCPYWVNFLLNKYSFFMNCLLNESCCLSLERRYSSRIVFPNKPVSRNWLLKRELQFVLEFAIEEWIPRDGEAVLWTHWIRREHARLGSNGVLSPSNEEIRKNRNLFASPFNKNVTMPRELWRNALQPGNTLDARDEKCTAQSRLGKQPEYLGLDDYECDGAQLHYAICEVNLVNGNDYTTWK